MSPAATEIPPEKVFSVGEEWVVVARRALASDAVELQQVVACHIGLQVFAVIGSRDQTRLAGRGFRRSMKLGQGGHARCALRITRQPGAPPAACTGAQSPAGTIAAAGRADCPGASGVARVCGRPPIPHDASAPRSIFRKSGGRFSVRKSPTNQGSRADARARRGDRLRRHASRDARRFCLRSLDRTALQSDVANCKTGRGFALPCRDRKSEFDIKCRVPPGAPA